MTDHTCHLCGRCAACPQCGDEHSTECVKARETEGRVFRTKTLLNRTYYSDQTIDSVLWAVKDREFETPSTIARRAGTNTGTAIAILTMLEREDLVMADGNGAWTRYRRFR